MIEHPTPVTPTSAPNVNGVAVATDQGSLLRALQTLNQVVQALNTLNKIVQGVASDLANLTAAAVTDADLAAWTGSTNLAIAGNLVATSYTTGDLAFVSDETNALVISHTDSDGNFSIRTWDGALHDLLVFNNSTSPSISVMPSAGRLWLAGDNLPLSFGVAEGGDAGVYFDGTDLVVEFGSTSAGTLQVTRPIQAEGYYSATGAPGIAVATGGLTFENGLLVSGALDLVDLDPTLAPVVGTSLFARAIDQDDTRYWLEIPLSPVEDIDTTSAPSAWARFYDGVGNAWTQIANIASDVSAEVTMAQGRLNGEWVTLGTADISDLGSWTGTDAISSVGTITSGTWSSTTAPIAIAYGGTGLDSLGSAGDILVVNGTEDGYAFAEAVAWDGVTLGTDAPTARTTLGLGNVEDTALSTWAGSENITTAGTVTTGTWAATTVDVEHGGTGITTAPTANYVLCGSTGTPSVLEYRAAVKWDGGTYAGWNATTAKTSLGIANVENTALSTWAGTTNLTTLGVVATGTWAATVIGYAYGGTGLTSLGSASQLLGVNTGGTALEYKTLTGTTNQVIVTPAANAITLSLPQSISTTSSPTFASMTLTGNLNVTSTPTFAGQIQANYGMIARNAVSTFLANFSVGDSTHTSVEMWCYGYVIFVGPNEYAADFRNGLYVSSGKTRLQAVDVAGAATFNSTVGISSGTVAPSVMILPEWV